MEVIVQHHLDTNRRGDRRLADTRIAIVSEGRQERVCLLKQLDYSKLLNALLPLLPFTAL